MKIINLLNKIANNEEIPQTFIYNNLIFELDETGRYIDNEGDYFSDSIRYDLGNLNEKVIIIEEEKKIEEDNKIENLVFNKDQDGDILVNGVSLIEKVNEIIDIINKEK